MTEAGSRGQIRQSILVGMGVHSGFADLIVISGSRVLFLEVKSPSGRLRKSQEVFRDTVCGQGFGLIGARNRAKLTSTVGKLGNVG